MARAGGKLKEDAFNEKLGEVIEQIRPDWEGRVHAEKNNLLESSSGKRVDILIAPDNLNPVSVESAFEKTPNIDQDAINRLGERVVYGRLPILTSVAVVVPNEIRHMHNPQHIENWLIGRRSQFKYAAYSKDEDSEAEYDVRYPIGRKDVGYLEGDAWDFTNFVEMSSTPDISVQKIALEAAKTVRAIACLIADNLDKEELAQILEIVGQPEEKHATSVAACIWLNAMILHARIAETKGGYKLMGRTESLRSPWDVKNISELLNEWNGILMNNHSSVFEPARDSFGIVDNMKRQNVSAKALSMLKETVKEVCTLRIGPVGDIGAQIFPELAADRKETAAFYTIPSSAELLAGMAAQRLPKEKRHYSVGDFASGTGTLLKAAYRTIIRREKGRQDEPKKRHKEYMEHHLYGADIQPLATHLTCAGLAGIYPDETFDKDHIVCAPISKGRVGSLELLGDTNLGNLLQKVDGKYDGKSDFHVPDASLDLVIMNPPYSIGGSGPLAFGHSGLKEHERIETIKKAERLFRQGAITGSMRAGLALSFASLADKKLAAGGVFAFVLPMTSASSSSWAGFRRHMIKNYQNLIVVSCDESFSESTNINEILVCGRKRKSSGSKPESIFMVTLKRRPKDFVEAHALSQVIRNLETRGSELGDILIGTDPIGSYYISEPSSGEPWSTAGHNVEIKKISERLATGTLLYPGMTKRAKIEHMIPISDHSNIGVGPANPIIGNIEGKTIVGAFSLRDARPEDNQNLVLWKADCKSQKSLFCDPTHRGWPRPGQEGKAEKLLKDTCSTLFMAKSLRITSQPLAAAMTKRECIGGPAWTTLICNKEAAPAYWLWLNSIFGLLARWNRASKTQTGRISMTVQDIKNFPCPDFSSADSRCIGMRDIANNLINNFDGKILKPCSMAWIDSSRHEIDNAVLEMMGINMSQEELKNLRKMWCSERSVHGNKKEIVRQLKADGLLTE